MQQTDLIGFGLFLGYFVVTGLPALLIKRYLKPPFEIVRKILHLIITMSIFLLVELFSTWYVAVFCAALLVVIAYPALALLENTAAFKRIAVEREGGEFKRSLIIVQVSLASLIFIFWGLMGEEWRYIAVVAVMAWGFGDAAAALIGKNFGRRRISHPLIEGAKTYEGTLAMFLVAGISIFITLLIYAGLSWQMSLAIAALVAPVSATVELFSRRGMDTLTVPISSGVTTLAFVTIFSFLGV